MIVLLEGPDGGGKSTLGQALLDHQVFQAEIAGLNHEGPEPELNAAQLLERYLLIALHSRMFSVMILDRYAVSERIYAKAFNREDRLGAIGEAQCLSALRRTGHQVYQVMCLPASFDAARNAVEQRGDTLVNIPTLRKVWSDYSARLVADTGRRWIHYDWTVPGALSRMTEFLVERAIEEKTIWPKSI